MSPDNEETHGENGRRRIYLYISTWNKAAETLCPLLPTNQMHESLKRDKCSTSTQQRSFHKNRKRTTPVEDVCVAHGDAQRRCLFQPGPRQISATCAARAAYGSTGWFFEGFGGWQVHSLLNVRGLSLSAAPEPPAGSELRRPKVFKSRITDPPPLLHVVSQLWSFNRFH